MDEKQGRLLITAIKELASIAKDRRDLEEKILHILERSTYDPQKEYEDAVTQLTDENELLRAKLEEYNGLALGMIVLKKENESLKKKLEAIEGGNNHE